MMGLKEISLMVQHFMERTAPTVIWILAAEDFLAAAAYAISGNWRWATYWFAAGVICSVVPKG